LQFNRATLPGQIGQTTPVMAVKPNRWLAAQRARCGWAGDMHLENEMIADRQQAVGSYAGRQQGECGIEQGAASVTDGGLT
jgi:hypothetical protein